ncbi:MAG: hypothetical protein HBSAPP03_08490 [Phycisphaerae bacterium]|nr:MAG: hypothetical protein HBSAPP03_08490 [Phycisphaerae bacterium]
MTLSRIGMLMVIALAALWLPGCKAQDRAIGLRYIPAQARFNQKDKPVMVLMTKEAHGLPSSRTNLRIIGEFTHQSGKKQADVLSAFPINEWARGAIAGELRAAGINASEADAPRADLASVESTITEMGSNTKNHWSSSEITARVVIAFRVVSAKGVTEFTSSGDGSARSAQGVLLNVRDAYENALRNCLKDAVPRIASALKN